MTVLLIGGGVVGSQIARILVEAGERPVVMDRALPREAMATIVDLGALDLVQGDVLNPLSLSEVIVRHKVDGIIHTAAHPMLTQGAQKEPYAAIQLNIMGTVNVLEAARIHGVKRVVVASSSVLNGFFAGGEAAGDMTREEALPRPTTFYAATKQAVESIGLNYARHCGIEFAAMRYGPVAGPWLGSGGGEPTQTFRRVIEAALKGEEVTIPPQSSEWVYSKDAAAATVSALRAATLGSRVFNVTMGVAVTPDDLAAAVTSVFPSARIKMPPLPTGATPPRRHAARLDNARAVLGYEPRYPIAAALRDYAAWWRGNSSSAERSGRAS